MCQSSLISCKNAPLGGMLIMVEAMHVWAWGYLGILPLNLAVNLKLFLKINSIKLPM